jgi:hypothetical protein
MAIYDHAGQVLIPTCEGIQIDRLLFIDPACLWLADTQFSHAGAQCAAVEPKDFCSPVAAHSLSNGPAQVPAEYGRAQPLPGFFAWSLNPYGVSSVHPQV